MVPVQEDHIDWKFHTDRVNSLARHQPQGFFRTQVGSFEQPDQASKKIIRLSYFGGEPRLFSQIDYRHVRFLIVTDSKAPA